MYLFRNPRLKTSIPIVILAISFMVIPIVNLPLSIYYFSPEHWTDIHVWKIFIQGMVLPSKIWGILIFIAGFLLLFQRKWTWAVAVATLLYSAWYTWAVIVPLQTFPSYFKVFSFLSILGALCVLFFFRFPYLDTRDYWWGIAHRFTSDNTGFPVNFLEDVGEAEVMDISIKGMKLRFKVPEKAPKVGDVISVRYYKDLSLRVKIMRIIGPFHGSEFYKPNFRQRRAVKELIRILAKRKGTFVIQDE